MKKFLHTLIAAGLVAACANNAAAANRNVVFAGYSFGEDASYAYAGGASALSGDIEGDGALLRVSGGYGKYNYTAPSAPGANVRGQVSSGDLMAGYQHNFSNKVRLALYAGANYDDYKLNKADNENRVTGGKAGAKGQVELLIMPCEKILIRNISNYTSAYNSYWSQTMASWNFGSFAFGPEVALLGNRAFNQQRFGGGFSQIDLGITEAFISGGYMKSSGLSGDDGAYVSLGFASKF